MTFAQRMHAAEGRVLRAFLRAANGNVREAAKAADLNRTHFYKMMSIHGIAPPQNARCLNRGNAAWQEMSA